MDSLYIKAPDGRIIPAPRAFTTSKAVAGVPVTAVNVDALKPGWSVATAADLAALKAAQDKAEIAAALATEEQAASAARLAAALAILAAPPTVSAAPAKQAG